jgi:CO/xanthine dehydrogenase FAD-binding subunit
MEFIQPSTWEEALAARAAHPDALPIQGGTDVMVEMNFARTRPDALLDLTRVRELREWQQDDQLLRVGAGVTYARLIDELRDRLPGLALASRTVGSPQIRNRGTVGGNLGAASPAGDSHPPLLAADATYEVVSEARGTRMVPAHEFYVGPKRNALEPDELIAAIHVKAASGGQQFAKIGNRNAMVIAACSFAVCIESEPCRVGTGIGSAGPTPLRALEAEAFLTDAIREVANGGGARGLSEGAVERFGELVAAAAMPIDDVRATAAYRRHALKVLAQRALAWAIRADG